MIRRCLILMFLCCPSAWAACTGSSPTWTSTPDFASVNTCLTNASRNDTVNVSAGSATWASTLNIMRGVKLLGAGRGITVITSSGGVELVSISPDSTAVANEEIIKVSGFTFDGAGSTTTLLDSSGASGISGTKPWRSLVIVNNTFSNANINVTSGALVIGNANGNGQIRGVIGNNIFDKCAVIIRAFSNNDTREWANTAFNQFTFGTADNLYFESNTIQYSTSTSNPTADNGWIETGQGARLIVRYNTWNMANSGGGNTIPQSFWDTHGFQSWSGGVNSGNTGTMPVEYYGNTITTPFHAFQIENMRASWGLFYNNIYTGPDSPGYDLYGESPTGACPSDINPTPTNYIPYVNNTYFFNNQVNGSIANASIDGFVPPCITGQNTNWWNYNAACTTSACSTGIGRGTTPPTGTCTTGVGYWVNSTPTPTASSSVTQAGQFYKCTSTNTWTLYYTPFTFPHPLLGPTLVKGCVVGNEAGTASITTPSCVNAAGDFLIVTTTAVRPFSTLTLTDTVGDTFINANPGVFPFHDVPQDGDVYVWYVASAKGGSPNTFTTVPTSGNSALEIHVSEWTGMSGWISDQTSIANGATGGSSFNSGTKTPSKNGELVLGYTFPLGNALPGAGFTQITFVNGDLDEYLVQAIAAPISATFTSDNNGTWLALMQTFMTPNAGTPTVSLSPTSLSFGNQPIQVTSTAQNVTLTNSGTATLTITSIALTGANSGDFAISSNTCGAAIGAGNNCVIGVTFTPLVGGSRTANLTFSTNAASSPNNVPLSGTGLAPIASFNPTSLGFGNQLLNITSGAQNVTLTNTGAATMTITSVTLTGTGAAQFAFVTPATGTDCRVVGTLAVSAQCIIAVLFTPNAIASFTASISVADNATGSPQTVALTGTGVKIPAAAPQIFGGSMQASGKLSLK